MLTAFGTFWGAEGAGADWPGANAALLVSVPPLVNSSADCEPGQQSTCPVEPGHRSSTGSYAFVFRDVEERCYQVDRQGKHDRGFLAAQFDQGLLVAQLHRCRVAAEHLRSLEQFL